MRVNMPVTTTERELREDSQIVSKTDLGGVIIAANAEFVAISGFTEKELLGAPHNLVRHPDMPAAAFRDLWDTVRRGEPWTGVVKNRCKNGDFYWVKANVTPIREDGRVVGYMSVRSKPTRAEVGAADHLYREMREGRAKGPGLVAALKSSLHNISLRGRVMTGLALFAVVNLAMFGVLLNDATVAFQAEVSLYGGIASAATLLLFLFGWLTLRSVRSRLAAAEQHLVTIAEGHFNRPIEVQQRDEVGRLMFALKSMQIKFSVDMTEALQQADAALRVQTALDNVSTNVMIADTAGQIIYLNRSVTAMLSHAEADIRKDLPRFVARDLMGRNIGEFHRNPAHQDRLLGDLRGTHRAHIAIGGRSFDLVANPVNNAKGKRLGTVVEWSDVTDIKRIQSEVEKMVHAAEAGQLTQRLDLSGKEGFLLALAEALNQLLKTVEGAVTDTVDAMESMAQGDFTVQIGNTYGGAFARIREATNATIQQLGTLVGDIRAASETVASAAREIAMGNADLSRRTEQEAAALEQTGATMEGLTTTVKQNTSNATQANQFALGARGVAERGGALVEQVVQTMGAITDSSAKIADIISVIDGIAFQTNILALNAAVEAARAGEQGRGFSVVAAEVRNLAGRSATAAKEIKTLIGASTTQVNNGSRLVGQAGQTMGDIVQAVKQVTDLMSEISAASEEQSRSIEQVNQAVSQMDETTQQNAALVEEAAAAAESLQEQAEQLLGRVSQFKLSGDVAGTAKSAKPSLPQPKAPPQTKHKALTTREPSTPAAKYAVARSSGATDTWKEF